MSSYEIVSSTPTTYQDAIAGVVNGVLIRFKIEPYNEVHEVRIPRMEAKLAQTAIEQVVEERDALALLGK